MYTVNIEKETLKNKMYRKVLYTDEFQQLVVMCLDRGEDIPLEMHGDGTQFIRIESGKGYAILKGKRKVLLKDGVSLTISPGEPHYVTQTGTEPLKLYTIYSPPEHPKGLKQSRQKLFS